MIKILHVLSGLGGGGVENMLYNYYKYMNQEIYKYDFIIHDPHIGFLEEKFKKLGCNIYHVTTRKTNILKNIAEIDNIIKAGNYDIIHCHQNASSFIPLLLAQKNNIKIRIAHSHSANPNQTLFWKVIEFPIKILTKYYSTSWLACSNNAAEWLFGKYRNKETIFILNNVIDFKKFAFNKKTREKIRKKFGWENKFVIGNVARFFPKQKNHEFLIRVFKEININKPEAILVLIGGGYDKEKNKIRKIVDKLKLSKIVFFMGIRDDIEKFMQAMDCFVLPSKSEGFGIVLIEAQATGLRCFTSMNVPNETKVTDLIEYISLKKSEKYWARRIINLFSASKIYNFPLFLSTLKSVS